MSDNHALIGPEGIPQGDKRRVVRRILQIPPGRPVRPLRRPLAAGAGPSWECLTAAWAPPFLPGQAGSGHAPQWWSFSMVCVSCRRRHNTHQRSQAHDLRGINAQEESGSEGVTETAKQARLEDQQGSASPAAPGGLRWSGLGGRIEPDQVAVLSRTGRMNWPDQPLRAYCPTL